MCVWKNYNTREACRNAVHLRLLPSKCFFFLYTQAQKVTVIIFQSPKPSMTMQTISKCLFLVIEQTSRINLVSFRGSFVFFDSLHTLGGGKGVVA